MPLSDYKRKPDTYFSAEAEEALRKICESEYSVLVGRNNCGKSFLLRSLTQKWGYNATYLAPARYQNFHLLSHHTQNPNRKKEKQKAFNQQWKHQQQNNDHFPVSLQQAIAELSDIQRGHLIEIIKNLFGIDVELRYTDLNNSMSQQYISCGGHNISYTSSGFRLITTLVTSLLDTDYEMFLIDEPELGISPETQGILADFLFDQEHRKKYFPHVKTLVFATHSTIFLDRVRIKNNYIVEKRGDEIAVRAVETQADFNDIHFFLLGNRFETLYLPSAIVLVEGKTDEKFIKRVVSLRYPDSQISIISANGDGEFTRILNIAKGLLLDIQRSPYRDRIFVILDSRHSSGLPKQLTKMGIWEENIVVWPNNGIEFYYPPSIIDRIFGAGSEIAIEGDHLSRNGITHKKVDLVDEVVEKLEKDTEMEENFQSLFLSRLEEKLHKNG